MLRPTRRTIVKTAGLLGLTLQVARAPAFEQSHFAKLPFLRGVNFTGLTHEPGSLAPAIGAVEYYIRQKQMNVVRLNFTWEMLQRNLGDPIDELQIAILKEQVTRITDTGAYLILDLHNYGRRLIEGANHIIGETPLLCSHDFARFWSYIAKTWKGNDRVIFGLMNEPHDQDVDILVEVTNAAIAAIRVTGAQNLILAAGTGWNSLAWGEDSQNQVAMKRIYDTLEFTCFDVHHYFDEWSRGQSPNVRANPMSSIYEFTKWARENGKRAFCGEFACYVNSLGLSASRELLRHLEDNKDVYIGWAWLGAGGPWQPDFIFLLDPFASAFSLTNPNREGAVSWIDPVDRPQMKIISNFLPQKATRFNGWLIEDDLDPPAVSIYRRGDFQVFGSGAPARWKDSGKVGADALASEKNGASINENGSVKIGDDFQLLATIFSNPQNTYKIIFLAKLRSYARAPLTILSIDIASQKTLGSQHCFLARSLFEKELDEDAPQFFESVAWNGLACNISSKVGQAKIVEIFDVVIVDGRISKADRARVEGRLHWDNGMAHLLPSDHDYRIKQPMHLD